MNLNRVRGALKPSPGHICLSCLLRGSSTSRKTSRRFLTVIPRIYPTPEPPIATAVYGKPKEKNESPAEESSQTTTSTAISNKTGKSNDSKEADTLPQREGLLLANPDKSVVGGEQKQGLARKRKRKERHLKSRNQTKVLSLKSEEPSAEPQSTQNVIKKAMELAERLKPQVAAQKQELKIKDKLAKKTTSSRLRLKLKIKPLVRAEKQELKINDKSEKNTAPARARQRSKIKTLAKPEKVVRTPKVPSEKATRARKVMSSPAPKRVTDISFKIKNHNEKGAATDAKTGTSLKEALSLNEEHKIKHLAKPNIETSSANDLVMTGESLYHITVVYGSDLLALDVEKRPVPNLSYGLERVLFNPGVYHLQDPRSRVFNFDPYLKSIMPVSEFDFNALKQYVTSSRDSSLTRLAKTYNKRYTGSTSSMTGMLAHFHFLLSQWRPINTKMLSKGFKDPFQSFTLIQRAPSAIFLRWQNGSYAIDADKEFERGNVLSMLGKSLEKLLTLSTEDYEKYRKNNSNQISEEERNAAEAFHYSTLGDFLMRSQLDAHDARLPGTGMFDLKTRAVLSIRMDVEDYEQGRGYQIKSAQGEFESFEREYYDMIRAAFLKYSLQVRMGRMDGIFVAFHNTERIFGFQYISLPEMDDTIHGQFDTTIGDQEFKLSLDLFNKVLDKATKKFPEQSLRIFVETRESQTPFMYFFAEPVGEEQIQDLQTKNSAKIREFERDILGLTAEEEESEWSDIQAQVQEAMANDEKSVDETVETEQVQNDAAATAAVADDDDEENVEEIDNEGEDGDDVAEGESEGESDGDKVEDDSDPEANEGNDGGGCGDSEERTVVLEYEEPQKTPMLGTQQLQEGDPIAREHEPKTYGASTMLEDAKDVDSITDDNQARSQLPELGQSDQVAQLITNTKEIEDVELPSESAESEKPSSDEDQAFLDEVARVQSFSVGQPQPEILAMTLTVRNKLNGSYILRPEKLREHDAWSVEYALNEVPNQVRAWSLYQACQMRRRKQLDNEAADENGESRSEGVNFFVRRLKEVTKQSREWRIAQDEIEAEQPVVVLGRSLAQKVAEPETQPPTSAD